MKRVGLWAGAGRGTSPLVQLAVWSEVASSIVLPWLLTSPLTSTDHFSNVCVFCPKGGQRKSRLPCLPAVGGALAGPHWEPASQRARHHLHSGLFLTSAHLQTCIPSCFICPSVYHHSVTTPQSFTVYAGCLPGCWE